MYQQPQSLSAKERLRIEVTAGNAITRYSGGSVPPELEDELNAYIGRSAACGLLAGNFKRHDGSMVHVWLDDPSRRRGIHFVDYGR